MNVNISKQALFHFFVSFSRSDVQKMEKEQEVERERDRARSTKFFDPKFNFNEPPPKVGTLQNVLVFAFDTRARFKMLFFNICLQPSRKPGRFRSTLSIGLHIQVQW